MNFSMVRYVLGWLLRIEASIMIIPCLIALIYQEVNGWYFFGTMILCAALGWGATRKKTADTTFYAKEGLVSVALSWIVLSFFGALPFYLSGEIPRFEDAMFETISGFSTTGATILTDITALSRCMLIWRSLTLWIGGMGVLVFMLAILPLAGGYNIHIMRAEAPGPSVQKLVPKVRSSAKILYSIYITMTMLQILFLLLGGMPWFDTLAISFSTAGAGGFSTLNDSVGSYTTAQQMIIMVFMVLFGINFNCYYLFLIKKPKEALKSEEIKYYLGIIIVATILVVWNIKSYFTTFGEAFHHGLFQVVAVSSTAAFTTVDFNQWPTFSKMILTVLMFIGACAGSTGCGFKVSRVVIAVKTVLKEMSSLIHPRSVKILTFEGKRIEHNVIRSINTYFLAYSIVFAVSALVLSLNEFDLVTTIYTVISSLNNIGFGFEGTGLTSSFEQFSIISKCVIMFNMLAGRLEIFPMLLLLMPKTWRS